MKHVLIFWDEFGQNVEAQAFLFPCKTEEQYKRLLKHQGKFVNSMTLKDEDPLNEFSNNLYAKKFDKYKVKWPIKLDHAVTIVHTGFLP